MQPLFSIYTTVAAKREGVERLPVAYKSLISSNVCRFLNILAAARFCLVGRSSLILSSDLTPWNDLMASFQSSGLREVWEGGGGVRESKLGAFILQRAYQGCVHSERSRACGRA